MEKPIYSSTVIDLITASVEYCKLLEMPAGGTRTQWLEQVTRLLPLVYVKASLLPNVETVGDDELPEIVTEDDYNAVRHSVWRLLGEDDDYLEVFVDGMQFSEGPMVASVSEDLADIYQDLKNFVAVYAGTNEVAMNNAIQKVGDNFVHYWGQKLVNVMRPLHDMLYSHHNDHEHNDDADDCHDPDCTDPTHHHHNHTH